MEKWEQKRTILEFLNWCYSKPQWYALGDSQMDIIGDEEKEGLVDEFLESKDVNS